jgi:anti-sigma B factor antagonist
MQDTTNRDGEHDGTDGAGGLPEAAVLVEFHPPRAPDFAAVVSLHGEHDLATRDAIGEALDPLLGTVLVDLSGCEFVDSTVIGLLLRQSERLQRDGHRLEVLLPASNETVGRVFDIAGLRSLLTVHEAVTADGASPD